MIAPHVQVQRESRLAHLYSSHGEVLRQLPLEVVGEALVLRILPQSCSEASYFMALPISKPGETFEEHKGYRGEASPGDKATLGME